MRKGSTGQTFLALLFVVCGLVGVFGLSRFLEANRPAPPENYADADLALQGARLKGYALGFEGLLADWYWMKSLQYIGDKIVKNGEGINIDDMRRLNPRLLYPYLDNATDLDPQFMSVYEYGAMVLPAIDDAQAIKLLSKGIARNPNNWRLYHYLGFIHWRLKNYDEASAAYAAGAQIEAAPEWMRLMAAKTKTEGGSRQTARIMYQQTLDESRDAQTRKNAAFRLAELDSLDEREIIQKILDDFKTRNNRCASNWREILPLLRAEKLPSGENFRVDNTNGLIDPTGTPYILNRENCQVKLDVEKTKIPLH